MATVEIAIDITGGGVFDDLAEEFEAVPEIAARRLLADLHGNEGDSMVENAFLTAIANAGPGFPVEYAAHLHRSLGLIRPNVIIHNSEIQITYTDVDTLGDLADLEEGFHFQAIETGDYPEGFSVEHPGPLKALLPGPDQDIFALSEYHARPDRRQEYWDAIVNGDVDFLVTFGPPGGKEANGPQSPPEWSREYPIPPNAYQNTIRARVTIWGGRYPEWLLLEDGWEGDPYIQPGGFGDTLEENVADFVEDRYQQYVDDLVAEIENGETIAKGGFLRNVAGQFTTLPFDAKIAGQNVLGIGSGEE